MQTTPPSSPIRTPCGSPCGSPFGFQIRSCFQDFPGTPPRALFPRENEIEIGSPQKLQKLENGRCQSIVPPEAPRKNKKSKGPIPGLPVLKDPCDFFNIQGDLGCGSYGEVFEVKFKNSLSSPTPSPSFAMKKMKNMPGGRISPNDLRLEAANFGSPGCVEGFGASSSDGSTYFGFAPIAIPLNKFKLSPQNIEAINALTVHALRVARFSVVMDASPENMGFIPAGTRTLVLDENGLPCIGKPIEKDCVKILDLGNAESPNDCTAKYGAVFGEDEMQSEEEKSKYRKFKCEMMTALLRNRISEFPRDEYDIVRNLCKDYGYTYAAGDRCEPLKY